MKATQSLKAQLTMLDQLAHIQRLHWIQLTVYAPNLDSEAEPDKHEIFGPIGIGPHHAHDIVGSPSTAKKYILGGEGW